MKTSVNVVVLGSLNVDYTYQVLRIPAPGETVSSRGVRVDLGGKGANQALAAQRAGAQVSLIGCVGEDEQGGRYLQALQAEGVDVSGVQRVSGVPTGTALICVDPQGENTIVVEPGANHAVDEVRVDGHASLIAGADALLVQLECPVPAVRRACLLAREAGVPVLFNPSPWPEDLAALEIPCDHLLVNASEAGQLLGQPWDGKELESARKVMEELGLRSLVITRGGDSTWVVPMEASPVEVVPPKVTPVDTVGAGDCFAGALAVALAEQLGWKDAVAFANAAGALATQRPGAQSAIPDRLAIQALLEAGE